MKFLKRLLLAILIIPCTFMFTACLNAEPNIYLVDVVFDDSGDEIICTYIYSNGYKKTKTIKNQGNISKSIVDISNSSNNVYTLTYSDGSTSQITIGNDNANSIVNFEKKSEFENVYIITYKDGSSDEIVIDNSDIMAVIDITKTPGSDNSYTITYSDGSTSQIAIDGDSSNSVINFEKKEGSDFTYIITYENGDTEEITIVGNNTPIEEYYETKIIQTYNKIVNSAVIIEATQSVNNQLRSIGSGVIYSIDKSTGGKTYILTNHHVIEDSNIARGISEGIKIYPYGSITGLTATCIGSSESNDVAILMVDTASLLELNQYCYAPSIADDRVLGDTAIAVGNPENQGMTITSGRVSLEYRQISVADSTYSRKVFGLDTPINSGNSGGGIFNIDGELIGLADAKMIEYIDTENDYTDNLDNMAYALPIELVDSIADNIIDQYKTSQTYTQAKKIKLGITIEGRNPHAEKDADGITRTVTDVTISDISATSFGYTGFGLRENDILTEIVINDTSYKINQVYDMDVYLLYIREGDVVKFNYTRNGTNRTSLSRVITTSDISTIVD